MRVLIRQVTRRKSGVRAIRDEAVDRERVLIGRGTDADIRLVGLSVALRHAEISAVDGKLSISALGEHEVVVNGRVSSTRMLHVGDTIRIGTYLLRVEGAEQGADVVVEVEQASTEGPAAGAGIGARTRLRIDEYLPATRSLAWTAAVLTIAVALVPIVVVRNRLVEAPADVNREHARPAAGDSVWLRSPAVLNPGPLSAGHAHLVFDCQVCHRSPFSKVDDATCLECHAGVAAHQRNDAGFHGFDDSACTDCHLDHRGAEAMASFSDAMCTACHANIEAALANSTLEDVAGFAAGHPEFRPSVVTVEGKPGRARLALEAAGTEGATHALRERSGLRFPHDRHLREITTPVGVVRLECADCHRPTPAGGTMRPIVFEEHCQRCHSIAFDQRDPSRELPHGEASEVMRTLLEYYSTLALRGEVAEPDAPAEVRRRPGVDLTETERAAALAWAESRTERAARDVFGKTGLCKNCHSIGGDAARPEIVPVHVVPYADQELWMPLARFDHEPHRAVDCERCHAATRSESSESVLMPALAVCKDCHGTRAVGNAAVESPCLLCHEFHHEPLGPMRPAGEAEAAAPGRSER